MIFKIASRLEKIGAMAKLAVTVAMKMPKQKKASQTNKKKGGTVATKVKPAKNKKPKKFYVVQVSGMDGPTKYSSKAKALRGLQRRSRLEGPFGREDGARVMGPYTFDFFWR